MKGLLSTGSALVTILLASTPTNAGGSQFMETDVSSIFCSDCYQCEVSISSSPLYDYAVIRDSYRSDLNGVRSAKALGGMLTVDFSAMVPGDTPFH